MEKDEINPLLEKYYEGETSESEDQLLEQLLMDEKLKGKSIPERDVMAFFVAERSFQLTSEFDVRFAGAIEKTRRQKTNVLRWSVGIAASFALLLAVVYAIRLNDASGSRVIISTGPIEKRDIQLPDGSSVSLNYRSSIAYNQNFKTRELTLKGEAYFDVVPDSQRPFRIQTSATVTEVVGTSFNLSSNATSDIVELTVVTGSVAFSTFKNQLQERIFLSEGTMAIFDQKKNTVKKYDHSNPNKLAWKTGVIVFDDATMQEVIDVVGRYFNTPIRVESPDVLRCHFKGTFRKPSLQEVLDLLNFTMNIKGEMAGDTLTLTGKGCAL
jgi:transmembrane sensor